MDQFWYFCLGYFRSLQLLSQEKKSPALEAGVRADVTVLKNCGETSAVNKDPCLCLNRYFIT